MLKTYNIWTKLLQKQQQSDSNLIKSYADNKKKNFNSRLQTQTELYGIDFDKTLVKLNELSSTLLHNFSTRTFMKEVVVGGLIRRHPAGWPRMPYIFSGTGLGRHSEDSSPQGTRPLWPAQWQTRRDTGWDVKDKPVWHLYRCPLRKKWIKYILFKIKSLKYIYYLGKY